MKRLAYFILLMIIITVGCKKNTEDLIPTRVSEGQPVSNGIEPVPASPYRWTSLPGSLVDPPYNVNGQNEVMKAGDQAYCIRGFSHERALYEFNNSTKKWAASTDFTFEPLRSYLFSHQSKLYFGFTVAVHTIFSGMESIDVTTGIRTSVASFPGIPVTSSTSFAIGDKGYVLGGIDIDGNIINQFWEYNFLTNQWTNKGNSPLGARAGAAALVADGKAYLGGGYSEVNFNGTMVKLYKNDWLQFTPGSIFLAIKANFPGTRRSHATGFVINNIPFLGFGYNNQTSLKDFWRYSPSSDSWTQEDSWPGTLSTKNVFGGFSIGSSGYVVKGELAEFWSFTRSYIN